MPETSTALELIAKVVSILDRVKWRAYGDHSAPDYLSYIQGHHGDEATLMDDKLGEFLEQVQGFTLNIDLHRQTTHTGTGKRPDYTPDDFYLHPFIIDAKGSDTFDLRQHYKQIAGYMLGYGVRYGILSNMRDLAVFTRQSQELEVDCSFSFVTLYKDYKEKQASILQQINTKRFLFFVELFHRKELNRDNKIEAISQANHGTHDAHLDPEILVRHLHTIVSALHEDVRNQRTHLLTALHYNPDRKEKIALEIDLIAHEQELTTSDRIISAASLETLLNAQTNSNDGKATDRYFYQVAYFAMTRILLVRVWEDIGFIAQTLYNGGFKQWYEQNNHQIREVLEQAFHFAGRRYSWLYGIENNYTWYSPSEEILLDVLYDFSQFDFRRLNADVLGAVYESYLDDTDRKNKGQYYTPRPIVNFMWNRLGFTNSTGIFRFENGIQNPRICLDFCTGSGGFLVEAARRIRETLLGDNFNPGDASQLLKISEDKLRLAFTAIIEGLRGSEINGFAYYLTEVNLLIQLTTIIAAIQKKNSNLLKLGRDYSLAIIHQDSLKLHEPDQHSLVGEEFVQRHEVYEQDRRRDIVNMEGYKKEVYSLLKGDPDKGPEADYVCSNPPYVGEKGHRQLFRETLANYPYWKSYYKGKMDYLYWFIILGLSKLRPGGQLCYITTSYWLTAQGASKLRQYVLEQATIKFVVDFGEVKIFEDAIGQHNIIFGLERCPDQATREAHRPLLVRVFKDLPAAKQVQASADETVSGEVDTSGSSDASKILAPHMLTNLWTTRLTELLNHIETKLNIGPGEQYSDEFIEVYNAPLSQGELSGQSWTFFQSEKVHNLLEQIRKAGKPLTLCCSVDQGVQSNADRLAATKLNLVSDSYHKPGDPIFVFTKSEMDALNLTPEELNLFKPFFKNSDITPYLSDPANKERVFILYLSGQDNINQYPNVKKHLQPYKNLLLSRDETYGVSKNWYELHRVRNRQIFEHEHLAVSRRAPKNTFGYSLPGVYENSDVSVISMRSGIPENLKYILALLNSKLLNLWCQNKNTRYGSSLDFFGRSLDPIPVRRINFNIPTPPDHKQAELTALRYELALNAYDSAYERLLSALSTLPPKEDIVHDGIVILVDEIIALKEHLAKYNQFFKERLTILEEDDLLPDPLPEAVLKRLQPDQRWSLSLFIESGILSIIDSHGISNRDDFYFYRMKTGENNQIILRNRGKTFDTITLLGEESMIDYLKATLLNHKDTYWKQLKHIPLPKSLDVYETEIATISQEVNRLRIALTYRLRLIDRLVLDLYNINDPGFILDQASDGEKEPEEELI